MIVPGDRPLAPAVPAQQGESLEECLLGHHGSGKATISPWPHAQLQIKKKPRQHPSAIDINCKVTKC